MTTRGLRGSRRGRPSSFTPSVQRRILQALRRGSTLKAAAQSAGISQYTLNNWLRRGESAGPNHPDEEEATYALFWADCDEAQRATLRERLRAAASAWQQGRRKVARAPGASRFRPAVTRTPADKPGISPKERKRFHDLLDLVYVLLHDPPLIDEQRKLLDAFLDDLDDPERACMDFKALANRQGVSRQTIYNWVRRGILPGPIRVPGTNIVWWPLEVIEDFERERAGTR